MRLTSLGLWCSSKRGLFIADYTQPPQSVADLGGCVGAANYYCELGRLMRGGLFMCIWPAPPANFKRNIDWCMYSTGHRERGAWPCLMNANSRGKCLTSKSLRSSGWPPMVYGDQWFQSTVGHKYMGTMPQFLIRRPTQVS